jgi:hypothetical protein
MVDVVVLKTIDFGREGSSPSAPILLKQNNPRWANGMPPVFGTGNPGSTPGLGIYFAFT